MSGGLFNEEALDLAALHRIGVGAVALWHEITKNRHEESGGADVEALVKGLACHARMIPILELVCDLVRQRQPGDHGVEVVPGNGASGLLKL